MPLRLAILGLDPLHRDWLEAVSALRASQEIELVGVGHRTLAAARDAADALKSPECPPAPVFDDLRLLLKDAAPRLILMDRPGNVSIDFLLNCVSQDVAILSLGPAIETLGEAQALCAALPARTHLLYTWPRFADAPASRHCAQAEEFVRPIRFASATWLGVNYALAKARTAGATDTAGDPPVRSLSVLAWDALATLIGLMDMPTSVYASIRGTLPSGSTFADLSGAIALTLRFADDVAASVTLCDRVSFSGRELLLWGAGGTLKLGARAYEFRDAEGRLIDSGPPSHQPAAPAPAPRAQALEALRECLQHLGMPPSPHRGWPHRLEEIAATMEALIVSHRTGQAESPERFRRLRR